METPETLTPEQIKNWRRIIAMQLESHSPISGIYAFIMPESDVIAFWKKMKTAFEQPEQLPETKEITFIPDTKVKCKHENSITGMKGKYCLDCEEYV